MSVVCTGLSGSRIVLLLRSCLSHWSSQIQNVLHDLLAGDANEAWLAAQKQGLCQLLAVRNSCHLCCVALMEVDGLLGGTLSLSSMFPNVEGGGLSLEVISFLKDRCTQSQVAAVL